MVAPAEPRLESARLFTQPAKWKPEQGVLQRRIEVWEKFQAQQGESPRKGVPIQIILPDGKVVDGVAGETTPLDVAMGISPKLAEQCVVAKLNYTDANAQVGMFSLSRLREEKRHGS